MQRNNKTVEINLKTDGLDSKDEHKDLIEESAEDSPQVKIKRRQFKVNSSPFQIQKDSTKNNNLKVPKEKEEKSSHFNKDQQFFSQKNSVFKTQLTTFGHTENKDIKHNFFSVENQHALELDQNLDQNAINLQHPIYGQESKKQLIHKEDFGLKYEHKILQTDESNQSHDGKIDFKDTKWE